MGYNAVDSWAGLVSYTGLLEESKQYGLKYEFYRDILKLTYIAELMRTNGINVDRKLAAELDSVTAEEKELLFNPPENIIVPFNPNSPKEAMEYFRENRLPVKDYTRIELENTIKKLAAKAKLDKDEYIISKDLSESEQWLIKAAQYKGLGKGLKGWFANRYFNNNDNYLHPRFITTGTQTGRWSCSGPNCMNFPTHKDD
jgi:DNA polymerase I-like protein with 3'-5' exonuclease and polymerase domains